MEVSQRGREMVRDGGGADRYVLVCDPALRWPPLDVAPWLLLALLMAWK